jgi:hypothetical protein
VLETLASKRSTIRYMRVLITLLVCGCPAVNQASHSCCYTCTYWVAYTSVPGSLLCLLLTTILCYWGCSLSVK